jgi:hypothetical protein
MVCSTDWKVRRGIIFIILLLVLLAIYSGKYWLYFLGGEEPKYFENPHY